MKSTFKLSFGYKIFDLANIIFMILVALICILPFIHVIAKAFNEGTDTALGGILFWPRAFTLENFYSILKMPAIYKAAMISILRIVLGTSLAIFVVFTAAYSLRKKAFPGRSGILIFLMIPMFIGGGLMPTYILFSRVGLLDNFLVYILPGAFSFFNMLIVRTFMYTTISDSLEESAKLDGANEFTILLKIYLPLCKPILATIMLWIAVAHWNDWTTTLYFVEGNKNIQPLQYKLMRILRESEEIQKMISENMKRGISAKAQQKITPVSLQCAQIIITILPIVLTYPFLQKYFIKGIMIGAIKE